MSNNNDLPSELEMLQMSQMGDNKAFEDLLEISFLKSKSIIQKQFNLSHHDLEDIIQSTSLTIWRKIKECKTTTSFYSWFYSVFKHQTIDFLRNKNEIETNEVSNILPNLNENDPNNEEKVYLNSLDIILADTARTFMERKEDMANYQLVILEMMKNLKEHHKQIINLILVEEKSYQEVSEILDIPLGSVMSRLYYAKIEAKKIINEYSKSNNIEFALLG
jgi:RNA polymerase sigma-70 factor (ECF subfamily)